MTNSVYDTQDRSGGNGGFKIVAYPCNFTTLFDDQDRENQLCGHIELLDTALLDDQFVMIFLQYISMRS